MSYAEKIEALIKERDDLRAALADRDAKLSELHLQYISDFGQLQAQEPAAMYLRECADGSLVQLYDDLKPGTKLYAAAGVAPVPEGWQLVPVEPTPDMCEVATWDFNRVYAPHEIYKAMLKLAPKEPT